MCVLERHGDGEYRDRRVGFYETNYSLLLMLFAVAWGGDMV